MFSAAVPQKWVFWLALVDITSLLFLSPKVMLQQDRASARTLQELKAQSLFTVAQGINSCRDKTIQHLQALPCLSFFFFFFFLHSADFIHIPKKCPISFSSYTGFLF